MQNYFTDRLMEYFAEHLLGDSYRATADMITRNRRQLVGLVCQPTNPPIHQPTNPPTHQPTNPPTHCFTSTRSPY
jgi:hypothetical protein